MWLVKRKKKRSGRAALPAASAVRLAGFVVWLLRRRRALAILSFGADARRVVRCSLSACRLV